jgi:serine/threonine-protein kinase
MGTVLAARDRETGRAVAVKWLGDPGSPPSDRDLSRFAQEARIAGSVSSPHVVRVFDVARDLETGVPYLVMERLDGEDLQALLDRVGPLAAFAAARIARQACAGVAAAHALGVVHRDLKPSNLFLSRAEGGAVVVKVVDFGIAKIRSAASGGAPASQALTAPSRSMTGSGDLLGSPLYMAPEQVEAAKHVDARADVFSLGVVLFAALTGKAPHAHLRSFVQMLYAIVNDPAPPLLAVAPWVGAELAAVVDRAMSHDLDSRFPDAAALGAALAAAAPGEPLLDDDMLVGSGQTPLPAPPHPTPDPDETTRQSKETKSFWKKLFRG